MSAPRRAASVPEHEGVEAPRGRLQITARLVTRPAHVTDRCGVFTMTARFDVDHAIALRSLLGSPDRCHRYVVAANLKERLRSILREEHAIWRGSLFPDTAGAAETAGTVFARLREAHVASD
jgi:hypothetical protein